MSNADSKDVQECEDDKRHVAYDMGDNEGFDNLVPRRNRRATSLATEKMQTQDQLLSTRDELENELTDEKLRRLQAVYEESDKDGGGGLDMDEFRLAMRTTMGNNISDEQLDMIFMKVDTNCDGTVDWDEYLTYMLLECRERDQMKVRARHPFSFDHRVYNLDHKDQLICVSYLPNLIHEDIPNRRGGRSRGYHLDEANGRYVSASRDGIVQFWCTNMKRITTRKIEPIAPQKSVWITGVVFIPRANVMVAGTTSGTLMIYDTSGTRFEFMSVIVELKGCPLAMNYWCSPSARSEEPELMMIGDDRGSLLVFRFTKPLNETHLNPKLHRQGKRKFIMDELIRGGIQHVEVFVMKRVHGDSVKFVLFCPALDCTISCCRDQETALFIGDYKGIGSGTYMSVRKGINTFDYCKRLNVIVTGSYDTIIRVWNPYINTKPVISLYGHKAPVMHVMINSTDEHVISIGENRDIRVHDLMTQTCIQTVLHTMLPMIGPNSYSAAMFNEHRQALLFGFKSLIHIQRKIQEVKKELSTQDGKITVALYNPIFHQVVIGGVDSTVAVWNIHSGDSVMQFKAHSMTKNGQIIDIEITAMAFGPRYRRLITGAQNGSVKIWNFNNGACLRELPQTMHTEVTSIVCRREYIAVAGWSRQVMLYVDDDEDDDCHELSPSLPDDVISLTLYPPNLIAAASYDGAILVWSLDTKQLVFFTSVNGRGSDHSYQVLERFLRDNQQLAVADELEKSATYQNTDRKVPNISVGKLLFITQRPYSKDTAILFVACNDGFIRAYSTHHEGGLKGKFRATKRAGCPVNTMVSDDKNELLITGDSDGYIRVWDITHYCNADQLCSPEADLQRAEFWKKFTFHRFSEASKHFIGERPISTEFDTLTNSREDSDSGSVVHLINSFRAHLGEITCLDYAKVHDKELLVSSCTDSSVRLWTLDGEFLGIFGQPTIWPHINARGELSAYVCDAARMTSGANYKGNVRLVPPDVRRVASASSLRVFYGRMHPNWQIANKVLRWFRRKERLQQKKDESHFEISSATQMTSSPSVALVSHLPEAKRSILGKNYKHQRHYRPLPSIQKPPLIYNQCQAFKSLPFVEMNNTDIGSCYDKGALSRIQATYNLCSLNRQEQNVFKSVAWVARVTTESMRGRFQLDLTKLKANSKVTHSKSKKKQPLVSQVPKLPTITISSPDNPDTLKQ